MAYAIPQPAQVALEIVGTGDTFPINRVFCVGRNYAAHAREMGRDPDREKPFFFMKPANAVVQAGEAPSSIPYPPQTSNFHHEIELVVVLDKGGKDIPIEQALDHVYGYAVGLDMTRRDLQLDARDKGRPWEFGKSFGKSAPIGPISRVSDVGHIDKAAIAVTVDGQTKQSSDVDMLIWSVAESIAYLSQYETLEPGDVIMTGTPEGVGAVKPGQTMVGTIAGLTPITVKVEG